MRRIFRARPNQTRNLRATMNRGNMPGRYVCHYGKNSGYSCGTVTSIALRPSYVPNATSFVQVRGNALSSCGGDSGGPWFNGTTAYGVHSGSAGSTGCNGSVSYAIFGSIRTAVNDLSVRLLFN